MLAIGAVFIVGGMFYGRPYCRWLCPYGALLSLASRVSWKNVRITPDKELDCGLCRDACPFGAIHDLRADRAQCVACARCYETCPREIERRGGAMPVAFLEWQAHQRQLQDQQASNRRQGRPAHEEGTVRGRSVVARRRRRVLVLASAAWMTFEYVSAARVEAAEKALVESLKARARTDATVHQTLLQPEFDRQRDALDQATSSLRRPRAGVAVLAGGVPGVGALAPARSRTSGSASRDLCGSCSAATSITRSRLRRAATSVRVARPSTSRRWSLRTGLLDEAQAVDLAAVDEIMDAEGRQPESVIPVLQAIQSRYRYLPDDALRRVAEASDMTPAQIAGVATFYGQFRQKPVGKHIIRVCEGTACHVSGAVEVRTELRRCLGMQAAEDTDATGLFTVERVACIGSCSLAPVMTIDEKIYGRLSALTAVGALQGIRGGRGRAREPRARARGGRGQTPGARRRWPPATSRSESVSGRAASRAGRWRCRRPSRTRCACTAAAPP